MEDRVSSSRTVESPAADARKLLGNYNGIARKKHDILIEVQPFDDIVVIEVQLIRLAVVGMQNIDLLAFGIFSKTARFAQRLHDSHPVRIRKWSFLPGSAV